ncbi:hypothetical protein BHM03_00046141 [Ensete ventricosum]|uniref:Uncharacterized protein n=1 Tax=Ensete ventricosum TaxID=4639 RepID=A0A445ML01_ENSVE|nr:hypothetical protein BHM03_00046141 [Ensete ventricosum]
MKRTFTGQSARPRSSQPLSGPVTKVGDGRGAKPVRLGTIAGITYRAKPPAKKTKVQVSKETLGKDTPLVITPKKAAPSEASHGEGSNCHRDKAMSRPRSMRDLCKVKAHSKDEPFLAQEMANLPIMFSDGPPEAHWAMLTRERWTDLAPNCSAGGSSASLL